ncbi:MAG: DUF4915 domain-containing protein [Cypionkella sp.]|nr:DUF4915 domain-containing protein [Cypionkella sp.]
MTEKFALTSSRGFTSWLAATGGSLAFTTYQAGKVFFLGVRPDGTLSVFERSFPRAMGLAIAPDARSLYLKPRRCSFSALIGWTAGRKVRFMMQLLPRTKHGLRAI